MDVHARTIGVVMLRANGTQREEWTVLVGMH